MAGYRMKENKKSHVKNVMRRTATLTMRDWDNHTRGGMAGRRTGKGKCLLVGPSLYISILNLHEA